MESLKQKRLRKKGIKVLPLKAAEVAALWRAEPSFEVPLYTGNAEDPYALYGGLGPQLLCLRVGGLDGVRIIIIIIM